MKQFRREFELHEYGRALASLDVATELMDACGPAFRFTGDFDLDRYDADVVPSMTSTDKDFSGNFGKDHQVLVSVIQSCFETIPSFIPKEIRAAARRFRKATAGMYRDHMYVCAEFGGAKRPSIQQTGKSEKMAVQRIQELMEQRLKLLDRWIDSSVV